jgi:5-methylcytosine-specific restriction endonuclease McrA
MKIDRSKAKIKRKYFDNNSYSNIPKALKSQWDKLSRQIRNARPLCEICQKKGKVKQSQCVDHIIEHFGREDLIFDLDNLQALCNDCHQIKTIEERKSPTRRTHKFMLKHGLIINNLKDYQNGTQQ